ncbi:hypothetical protein DSO57_1026534 [Entomophthora muscae]|uniref:Uncharacterized protein n=1 Tax=Entomophthora muscae TaxID=34485 RepID=A0ACC2T268_9FUNG|nr:hypothetical protein DSO57_1026534 [Entomophthora muscae]
MTGPEEFFDWDSTNYGILSPNFLGCGLGKPSKTGVAFSCCPVTSDKLLLTILIEKPQLRDQILTPRGPPSCPQFFELEPEQDLTSENPLKLDESNSPTSTLPMLKVPVNLTNQQEGPAIDPRITQAHTEGETEELLIERGPPRDNQPHNPTREFEHSQFDPANEITPAMDATKDWDNLVNRKTRAKGICESFTMTDGHTYPLDCQEDAHHHSYNKVA